ncbi:MAG: aminotransferase class IV [Pyrinomonadaceae bacterium]
MHRQSIQDLRLIEPEECEIDALSAAALYGRGVFTTIAIYAGQPFLWEKHWRRLGANSLKLRMDLVEYPESAIRKSLSKLILANKVENGRARITLFDNSPTPLWPYRPGGARTRLLITTAEIGPRPQRLRLAVSPFAANSLSPLSGVKSCNYLEEILAIEEAKSRGFDECIVLNERSFVTSACMANVFWLEKEKLFTPGLGTGCLAGTTREWVMESLKCEEVDVKIGRIADADAIFLSSAGLGVIQISGFEERSFEPIDHEIMRLIPAAV